MSDSTPAIEQAQEMTPERLTTWCLRYTALRSYCQDEDRCPVCRAADRWEQQLTELHDAWAQENAAHGRGHGETRRIVKLGVIEFHPNAALRERFYYVVDDLTKAGCIVDLWLMDIASVLREHGYEMTVTAPWTPLSEDTPT